MTDMAAATSPKPQPVASFEIHSGHLCYGALHNIYHGASSEKLQGFPAPKAQVPDGTVRRYEPEYNLPALKGTWHIYPLVTHVHLPEDENINAVAYFVCHFSVDPATVVDKILRVSGSPYEPDSGSSENDENTAREGIFVVNRYDWDYYDERGKAEVQEPDPPLEILPFAAVGVVDFDAARHFVNRLKGQKIDRRDHVDASGHGAWLFIGNAEYCFGRFGFDEEREHARSFLFFTIHTDFGETRFMGEGQPTLRHIETAEECFMRQLREGFDFSQKGIIDSMFARDQPPDDEMLGPYSSDEYVLTKADLETVRKHFPPPDNEIEDAVAKAAVNNWWSASATLTNEVLLSFLEYRIVLYLRTNREESSTAAIQRLFHTGLHPGQVYFDRVPNNFQHRFFGDGNNVASSTAIPDPEHISVKARIRTFLQERGEDPDNDFLETLCRNLASVVKGIVYKAEEMSLADERLRHIVPRDVFMAVMDPHGPQWYRENLSRSRVLWCR